MELSDDIPHHLPQPQSSPQPDFDEKALRLCTSVLTAKITAARMIAITNRY